MNISQILNGDFSSVIDLGSRKYYFVRTDSGEYFEQYYSNDFIAIGWNEITLDDLRRFEYNLNSIRNKVRNNPENRISEKKTDSLKERAITTIVNKNKTFFDLSDGDVIIMPSAGSYELAFGIVEGEAFSDEYGFCPHLKRRNIKWIRKEKLAQLDAKFGYLTRSFHAISEINDRFKDIIDNYMFDSYIKNDTANISFRLKTHEDISYGKLTSLIDKLIAIGENAYGNSDEEVTIKLNLQSPGFVNLKKSGRGLIFALALVTASCSNEHDQAVQDVLTEHNIDGQDLDSVSELLRELGGIDSQENDENDEVELDQ